MRVTKLQWLPEIVDKLEVKHGVIVEEVNEVFDSEPHIRRGPKGKRKGENVYKAYGRTEAGRYLIVIFIYKQNRTALVLSTRDMVENERRLYEQG